MSIYKFLIREYSQKNSPKIISREFYNTTNPSPNQVTSSGVSLCPCMISGKTKNLRFTAVLSSVAYTTLLRSRWNFSIRMNDCSSFLRFYSKSITTVNILPSSSLYLWWSCRTKNSANSARYVVKTFLLWSLAI